MTTQQLELRESKRLVRTYSLEATQRLPPDRDAYPLARILQQNAERTADPWRKFFEPAQTTDNNQDPISAVIAVEAAKLREKWVKFQQGCADEDKLDLDAAEPTMESVLITVQEMHGQWQKKRKRGVGGKAVTVFHKLCGTLDSHSALLKILPEGSEYVSLFSGSLNAIVKASVNYERVAEGLSEALDAISESVAELQTELEIFRTPAVLEKVADLYAHVFLFLSTVMDWLMRKHLFKMLKSFNENVYRQFEGDVQKIKTKAVAIRNMVSQGSRAELRATRLTLEALGSDIRVGLEGEERHRAEMEDFCHRVERELAEAKTERRELAEGGRQLRELAAQMNLMLEHGALAWLRHQRLQGAGGYGLNQPVPLPLNAFFTGPSMLMPTTAGTVTAAETEWMAEAVACNSAHLEDLFDRDRVRLPCDPAAMVQVPPEMLSRLAQWSAEPVAAAAQRGSNLWIDGPPTEADDLGNPLTALAAGFTELASRSGVPVLSYFCELLRRDRLRAFTKGADMSPQMQGATALAAALLRQMVELLLPIFEADPELDLSEARFRRLLGGTPESWAAAMETFRGLLGLLPDTVLCIIDGLHWLDDASTRSQLAELTRVLRDSRLKVLWTTSGRVPCLRELIAPNETLDGESCGRAVEERLDGEFFLGGPGAGGSQ